MILLTNKFKNLNINFYYLNIKKLNNILYFKGFLGCIKIPLLFDRYFHIKKLKVLIKNIYLQLNSGWVSILHLNGLGFKATKKHFYTNKKYWRFNVGHSHVFLYFTPKNIILKSRKRYICFFGYKKSQVIDITQKLKKFHVPDVYKGVGLKYPNEIIQLKKGKVRQ